jgi:tRNA (guanine10-N2)-dimethyltransferase
VTKLFFLLSGEHPTLPFSELKAVLIAEGFRYRVTGKLGQVLRLEADIESVKAVVSRTAMTRVCSIEMTSCNAEAKEIYKKVRSASIEGFLEKGDTFVVRVRRIGESLPRLVSNELEQKLGAILLRRIRGTKVRLTDPEKTFFGVLTDNKFIFGLKLAEIVPKPFVERRPRKRPFFHPSAMPSKLARCMVNLAQPRVCEVVLDPFCGTASMLIEAGLIGCRVVGLDAQKRMIRGSLRNLAYYGIQPEGLAVADAQNLPLTRVDCIVTDPPYGRSASTLGRETGQIVQGFLSKVDNCIPKGGRICIASPKSIHIGRLDRELAFKHVESHSVYVHRSLTREIAVLERT